MIHRILHKAGILHANVAKGTGVPEELWPGPA